MGYNVSPETMEAAREMAQAAERRLMHEPCLHVVLSPEPAEGGRLAPAALDHMVGDLMREMGWQDYQVLAVEHLDTDHQHVHLMINRAHPVHTGESIDGYYLYKDLRSWAQGFDARQQHVALDLFAEGYVAEPSPGAGTSAGERASEDRVPSPPDHAAKEGPGSEEIEQHQRSASILCTAFRARGVPTHGPTYALTAGRPRARSVHHRRTGATGAREGDGSRDAQSG